MKIVAIMIGRGGSSLKDKNILPVFGVPLLCYAASAAKRSRFISDFYISSDCPKILEVGNKIGVIRKLNAINIYILKQRRAVMLFIMH